MDKQEKKTVDIGQKILEIRKSEGLSQTAFAEKFHVTRQTVSNWEHGASDPSTTNLIALAKLYKIEPEELIRSITE